jgi:hypothetical protein
MVLSKIMKRRQIHPSPSSLPFRESWGDFSINRQPTAEMVTELIGLMMQDAAQSLFSRSRLLYAWKEGTLRVLEVKESDAMFSNIELNPRQPPFLELGFFTLPCFALIHPLNSLLIEEIWTAPSVRRNGLATALISLLSNETKFVFNFSSSASFVRRVCPALQITYSHPEPIHEYNRDRGSVSTCLLKGTNTLPRNEEGCKRLAELLNTTFDDRYSFGWLQRIENGIEVLHGPSWWKEEEKEDPVLNRFKQVRFDAAWINHTPHQISLNFKWANSRWLEEERFLFIACFMKVFGFTELDPAFFGKEEIEELLADR